MVDAILLRKNTKKSNKPIKKSELHFIALSKPTTVSKKHVLLQLKLRHMEVTGSGQLLLLSVYCSFVVRLLFDYLMDNILIINVEKTDRTWRCYLLGMDRYGNNY